jgi:hypothetical protein
VLHPRAVYLLGQARHLFSLPANCLPREARLGRLRVSKRGGRYYTTGRWLWEWLEAGEVRRTKQTTPQPCPGSPVELTAAPRGANGQVSSN